MPPEQAAEIQRIGIAHSGGNFGYVQRGGNHQILGLFQPQAREIGVGRFARVFPEQMDKMAFAQIAHAGKIAYRQALLAIGVHVSDHGGQPPVFLRELRAFPLLPAARKRS